MFKSDYAKLIIKYIKEKYNDDLEYLWESTPEFAIARNKINNKWYILFAIIDKKKLDIKDDEKIEIINIHLKQDEVEKLIDNENIFPGYHMNKKHWITIKLDESIDILDIYKLIDKSYKLSREK